MTDKIMKKSLFIIHYSLFIVLLCACAKQDPILPGERFPVFSSGAPVVENQSVPLELLKIDNNDSRPPTSDSRTFEQTPGNEIWEISESGERRKIFAGLATASYIDYPRVPVFDGRFVYAGLSTGEVIKVNPKTRELVWIADVYKQSLMTGGAQLLDISAPVVVDGGYVYAGGLGDAFCKLSVTNGNKIWCITIGVGVTFKLAGGVLFVSATDNNLYAIDAKSGNVYWRSEIKKQSAPKIAQSKDGKFIISVGKEKFDAETGKPVK